MEVLAPGSLWSDRVRHRDVGVVFGAEILITDHLLKIPTGEMQPQLSSIKDHNRGERHEGNQASGRVDRLDALAVRVSGVDAVWPSAAAQCQRPYAAIKAGRNTTAPSAFPVRHAPQETSMSTNFDAAINQARSNTDATDRATSLLQAIAAADTAAGVDKAKRAEFAAALSPPNVAKLAAAFAGE